MVILCFCSRCITLLLYHLRAFMSMYIYNKIAKAFLSLMHTFCPKRADFANVPGFYHPKSTGFSPDPSVVCIILYIISQAISISLMHKFKICFYSSFIKNI